MDAKIGQMIEGEGVIATATRIATTKIAGFAIAAKGGATMTVVAVAVRMIRRVTCAAVEVQMMARAICAVDGALTTDRITCVEGVAVTTRRAMIVAAVAGIAMTTAATMIVAETIARVTTADEEAIRTTWRIASTTAIQPPTPLARVAGVGAVGAAVAEETILPEATEPAGSRVAPVWYNRTGAALPLAQQ